MVKNKFGTDEIPFDPVPLQTCDEFISYLVSSIDVDIMPGMIVFI